MDGSAKSSTPSSQSIAGKMDRQLASVCHVKRETVTATDSTFKACQYLVEYGTRVTILLRGLEPTPSLSCLREGTSCGLAILTQTSNS